MTTAPIYDENDPVPYVDARIRAAFNAAETIIDSITRDDETTTVHTENGNFIFEAGSDDDAMLFYGPHDSCIEVVLFPED